MKKRSVFTGMQILMDGEWIKDHVLIVEDKKIKNILPVHAYKNDMTANNYEFAKDHYLIPGLIDLHIHGSAGFDVMDASANALSGICHALASEGVTGFLATTMTASDEQMASVLSTIAKFPNQEGAAILGIHLEGPFISAGKNGAQSARNIKLPDLPLIKHWQELAKGTIRLVTLAPELNEILPLIRELNAMGIVVSAGHTDATYAQTNLAIENGCTHATHLFNAMRGIHQREPGAVSALLLSKKVNAEIIVDGLHLHPAVVELILRLKGKENLLLVTDAMRAKCMGDGEYDLGGQAVAVKKNIARLADGTIAGSTLSMPHAIRNMLQFTQCSLIDAIQMASLNPARVMGMEAHKGSIAPGKDADLVVMNPALEVMMTMREGEKIYQ